MPYSSTFCLPSSLMHLYYFNVTEIAQVAQQKFCLALQTINTSITNNIIKTINERAAIIHITVNNQATPMNIFTIRRTHYTKEMWQLLLIKYNELTWTVIWQTCLSHSSPCTESG